MKIFYSKCTTKIIETDTIQAIDVSKKEYIKYLIYISECYHPYSLLKLYEISERIIKSWPYLF